MKVQAGIVVAICLLGFVMLAWGLVGQYHYAHHEMAYHQWRTVR